ncbi:MAG TPA: hypothetical protein VGD68_14260 [Streptosporangiaceae bacterium]
MLLEQKGADRQQPPGGEQDPDPLSRADAGAQQQQDDVGEAAARHGDTQTDQQSTPGRPAAGDHQAQDGGAPCAADETEQAGIGVQRDQLADQPGHAVLAPGARGAGTGIALHAGGRVEEGADAGEGEQGDAHPGPATAGDQTPQCPGGDQYPHAGDHVRRAVQPGERLTWILQFADEAAAR